MPLFILIFIFFIFLFFNDVVLNILKIMKAIPEEKDAEVDEKLGTYFQCLSRTQRTAWYVEEMHLR